MAFSLLLLLMPLASGSSTALPAVSSQVSYYFSVQVPDSNETLGYAPEFDVCEGGSSCSDCLQDAVSCSSEYNCYEPTAGQSCCSDSFGTACDRDFYCAYDNEDTAWCCAADTSIEDCSDFLSVDLAVTRSSTTLPSTIYITRYISSTLTPQSSTTFSDGPSSGIPFTPISPSSATVAAVSTSDFKQSALSSGAKAGIGTGVTIGVLGAAALGVFFWFRRRRQTKWEQVAQGSWESDLPEMVPAPHAQNSNITYNAPISLSRNPSTVAPNTAASPNDASRLSAVSALSPEGTSPGNTLAPIRSVSPVPEDLPSKTQDPIVASNAESHKKSGEFSDQNLDLYEMPDRPSK